MHNEAKNQRFADRLSRAAAALFSLKNGRSREEVGIKLNEKTRTVVSGAAYFVAALGAGGATALGALTPFGLAVVCSCGSFLPLVTVGACIGALIKGAVFLPAIYAVAMFIRLAVRKWTSAKDDRRTRCLVAGGCMALYAALSFVFGQRGTADIICRLSDIAACVFCTWCFCAVDGMEKAYTPSYETGIFLAVYAAGCSLSDVTLFSLSPGYILGFTVTVFIAFSGGALRGCVAGLLFGMGVNVLYAPSFAIAGLVCGRLRKNTMTAVGAAAVSCMIYAALTEGAYAVRYFLPDIVFAAVLYAPLCKFGIIPSFDIFGGGKTEAELEAAALESEKNRLTANRLDAVSGALHSLSAIFYGMSERMSETPSYDVRKDMTKTFASDYESVSSLIKNAVTGTDFPPDSDLSRKIRAALSVSGIRFRYVCVTGLTRKTVTVCGLSPAVAEKNITPLMRRAENMCAMRFSKPDFMYDDGKYTMTFRSLPVYKCEYSSAQSTKRGEKICGDSTCCFYDEEGNFFALLCDGMGSGKDAAVAARICCVFIEKMLEGGNDIALTLDMLNTFLRGKGYECFATIDMLKIDLFTGKAFFIKGGGAPSYLLRGGCAFRISSASTPVGIIDEVCAEKIAFTVEEGDVITMCSDGADDGEENITDEITSLSGGCAEMAQSLLLRAQRKYRQQDDASVMCIKVTKDVV